MPALDDLGPKLPGLAREAILEWLSGGGHGADRSEGILAQGPVFVSLVAAGGALRGCMGFWSGAGQGTPVAVATVRAAVLAAAQDPRFPPVAAPELARLRVRVSVATAPRHVGSAEELEPGVHGVIVRDAAGREAFLMPALPGVRDGAHLVELAREKAAIDAAAEVTLRGFTVATWTEA